MKICSVFVSSLGRSSNYWPGEITSASDKYLNNQKKNDLRLMTAQGGGATRQNKIFL